MKKIILYLFLFLNVWKSQAQSSVNPDKTIRQDFISLSINEDSLVESSFKVTNVEVRGKKSLRFLGSYEDWEYRNKRVWLMFENDLDKEFSDYLKSTIRPLEGALEVRLIIQQFQHKQHLFFNSNGCIFRYRYELYFLKESEKYSYLVKESHKLKDVTSDDQIIKSIKESINKLMLNTSLEYFKKVEIDSPH